MNRQRQALIDRLETSGKEYADYLSQVAAADLYSTSSPTEWSIHQVAAHVRDTEQHAFLIRVQRITKEEHPAVLNFDQDEYWKTNPYSASEPIKKIIADFRTARRKMVQLLRKATDKDWKNWAQHSAYGKISLDYITMHCYHHTLEHIAQMGYARENDLLKSLNS
ncbi:MAG: DinB family protein [Chloroflexi bacterium]|nr:DinB family protein [Chloroflexota bacterium]